MKHKYSSITYGAALTALSALGYSTNPIFGKFAYQAGANAISLGAIRFTLAALALWSFVGLSGKARGLTLAKRGQLLALGGLGVGMVALLYFTALEHIGASLATALFYTYPIMVALVGAARGEALGRMGYAGLFLAAAGTWLMLGTGVGGFTWQGALLILSAAALYSAYTFVGDRWARGVAPTVVSAHVTAGASVVYLSMALATGQAVPQTQAFVAGAGLALCSTILALITFFAGLPLVGATRSAVISTLEPAFTALLAVLFLGEKVGALQSVGIGLVVVGAIAVQLRNGPTMATPEQA